MCGRCRRELSHVGLPWTSHLHVAHRIPSLSLGIVGRAEAQSASARCHTKRVSRGAMRKKHNHAYLRAPAHTECRTDFEAARAISHRFALLVDLVALQRKKNFSAISFASTICSGSEALSHMCDMRRDMPCRTHSDVSVRIQGVRKSLAFLLREFVLDDLE